MNPRTEDMLGKALMIITFGVLAARKGLSLMMFLASDAKPAAWQLDAAAQFLSLFFVAVVVLLTVRRAPPQVSAAGLEPRLTAIAGTFALMALAWLPAGQASFGIQVIATLMLFLGTVSSIYCLHFLGRSFSIMASARKLVTKGPYGVVRHPLYLAEALSVFGIVLLHWSVGAAALGAIQILLQFRRMENEEAVLRSAFPEYADYAARVPMIVPGGTRLAPAR